MPMNTPDLIQVAEQVGLEEGELVNIEAQRVFVAASMAGLSDEDLVVLHEPYDEDRKVQLYGYTAYNEGSVAQDVARLALENGMQPGPVYDFQNLVAQFYDHAVEPQQETPSTVRVFPEAVIVDKNPLLLRRHPDVVVEYAACLTSRSLIGDQLNFVTMGARPFTYTPITRLHFANRVLMQTYDILVGPGTANAVINDRLYIGREDGVKDATNEMIALQGAFGTEVAIADVVIASGEQHTTPDDLKAGAENAYALTREDGIFIIRGFARPATDEVGTDRIVGWALDAGFREERTLTYTGATHNLGRLVLTGDANPREVKTVVLTK